MRQSFGKQAASALAVSMLLSATAITAAHAYEAGDVILRVGTATVDPESKSDDLDQLPGASVMAKSDTQLGLSGTYMFSSNWGMELLLASPFTHDITGNGTVIHGAEIGSAKQLPPTLSAQYYFMSSASKLQPYVGLGLNYTAFFSEDAGKGAESIGYNKLSLDDSFGLAASAGLDYMMTDNWGINASVMYAQIGTTATLKETSAGSGAVGPEATVDYDLDPMVYRLNVVYKF